MGLGTGPLPALAAPGTWCELKTEDFRALSNLDEQALRDLLSVLPQFRGLAEPYLPGKPGHQRAPLNIIVFGDRAEFLDLTGSQSSTGFMQPSLRTNRLLIGPLRASLTETALHEYAHYLLRNRLDVSLPVWFDEGLASLLGTARFAGGEAVIGELPQEHLRDLVHGSPGSERPERALARTLEARSLDDWSRRQRDAFYDWSLLLTHYLYLGPVAEQSGARARLSAYLQQRDASITAYLGLSERRLVRDLDRYLRGKIPLDRVSAPVMEAPSSGSYRCLDPLQRDHELAMAILPLNPIRAKSLLEPHLHASPVNADILVARSRIAQAEEDARTSRLFAERALAADPGSADALTNMADVLTRDCLLTRDERCHGRWQEAGELYRAALKVRADQFDAVLGLGLSHLYTGRAGEAVNYLKLAYRQAPWAAATNFYLGESYRLIGDTRATTYLVNAANWAERDVWRKLAEQSLENMDKTAEGKVLPHH